jgi:hypothetical protein
VQIYSSVPGCTNSAFRAEVSCLIDVMESLRGGEREGGVYSF